MNYKEILNKLYENVMLREDFKVGDKIKDSEGNIFIIKKRVNKGWLVGNNRGSKEIADYDVKFYKKVQKESISDRLNSLSEELSSKDFTSKQHKGFNKFQLLTSAQMKQAILDYKNKTGKNYNDVNNKGDFYDFMSGYKESFSSNDLKKDVQEYKKLRDEFMSYKFGFGSPEVKRLIELERKLKQNNLINSNGKLLKQ